MGVHWKIQFLGWGGLTKNQYIGGHGLKRGWGSLGHFVDLGGGGLAKKRDMVFLRGVDTPMHAMTQIWKTNPNEHYFIYYSRS